MTKKDKVTKRMKNYLFDWPKSAETLIRISANLARNISLFNVAANLEEILIKLSEVNEELEKEEE